MQSTGQQWTLQSIASFLAGQARPPYSGCVKSRVRNWVPPAHDLLHAVYEPHRPTTQSFAQLCALQSLASCVTGQALPPCMGAMCVRVRVWAPAPHDLLQLA
jgi:hypothetical protein